jgi:MFS family permease
VSHSASLSDYRTALTTPAAKWPVLASVLARLPIAMISLALLLYVQHATGSFAVAGLTSAAALVGVAFGSVIQGRIMDRLGPAVVRGGGARGGVRDHRDRGRRVARP